MRSYTSQTPSHRSKLWLLLCLLVICIGSWRLWHQTRPTPSVNQSRLEVRGHTFHVSIADTPAKQALGLSGVGSLSHSEGMYFPFVEPKIATFWMKGMRIPIDLLWIRNNTIIGIERNMPPAVPSAAPLQTWSSPAPVDAVLEIAAGSAAALSLQVGDSVSTEHIKMPTQ